MSKQKSIKNDFVHKLALQIVERRSLVFLIVILGCIFTIFSSGWIRVENDLTTYLPQESNTSQGLAIMEEQFKTYGSAEIMVANVTKEEADSLQKELLELKGVQMIEYDDTTAHYNHSSALYSITFDYPEKDEACLEALSRVKAYLDGYDVYVSTSLGNSLGDTIQAEVNVIMVYVAIIVVTVLIFTSQTYAEVPVLILTLVIGIILNTGTNFLLGEISFISNSVTSILQLALSLDYAIILCNHFKEQYLEWPLKEAVIESLAQSITEISASSMTTIGGLLAMMFMSFKIGPDMAICLIKAIFFSMLSVFAVMPGLLMLFGPYMERTRHKNWVPKISFVGKFAWKTRKVIPAVFAVVLIGAYFLQSDCPYAYGYDLIETPILNETQIAENMISDTFTQTELVALVVPRNEDYTVEAEMIRELESHKEIDHILGLSNIEAMDGYMLEDKLNARQFSELSGIDYELAQTVYAAYAFQNDEYTYLLGESANYKVALIDVFMFVCDTLDSGIVTLDEEMTALLQDAKTQMSSAQAQLQGSEYNRLLIYLGSNLERGDTTYAFTDEIKQIARSYYLEGEIYLVGDVTNEYDFKVSFATDNIVVTIISILIVLIVLLFTFQSVGMPILLILVIEGAIFINFSFPTLTQTNIFFMSYLIVSSIQMGANIDYAIVIATRFNELKNKMDHEQAMIETLNFAFPTILTSGSIMVVAGTLIGRMTSDAAIVGIGQCLGRGTIVSIFLVLFVLPQLLLVGSNIVDKTSFSMRKVALHSAHKNGTVRVTGLVQGEIHGKVYGTINAVVDGDVELTVLSGKVMEEKTHLGEENDDSEK